MKMKKRNCAVVLVILMLALLVTGCAGTAKEEKSKDDGQSELKETAFVDVVEADYAELEEESVALADSPPAIPSYIVGSAPGTLQNSNEKAIIDYSNTQDGYVMMQYTVATQNRIKALITGPTTQYQYNITPGAWATLPLSDGNGSYQIGIYENVKDTSYAAVLTQQVEVTLKDEFAPFLCSNQYVNFENAPNTVAKANELCAGTTDTLEKIKAVYTFVVGNLTYDTELAANVQSGYLPVLDTVLSNQKGICFDYAALMTGMLRSQGIPCKLVVGYAGTAYHAWINVWTEKDGWIDNAIYFDGTSWQRMDPTFASSGNQSESIMKYIGDGSNYQSKYFY